MLLKEEHTNLDDAYALHYAVAYCDSKTTTELLDLAIADGARPSDLTSDGRKALQISKRLTRAIDYYRNTEEGKGTPKDRLCIEILEQAERRDPLLEKLQCLLLWLVMICARNCFILKTEILDLSVALAKLLFPMEAKVAMDIAQVDGTSAFELNGINKNMTGTPRTEVDLNEAPFKIKEEHLNRLRALSKTVELGKRFFPRCSSVLNKIMDRDDYPEIAGLGNGSLDECPLKRQRRMEIEEILSKAFTEDKEEFDRTINLSSSSSSSSGNDETEW
ncbi:BTB/POZ domain and ankyrin repeat-containing protein NPR1 [Sesamum angolense]|uniref:BTB/POZ domain and ankyrin repeat-containing protein NPR1 n=1 Tax=Sesamum angolense TaxID=2727404 RepID=A0AAE1WEI9_9LAMI|nr:BTB/POZ domain and ankyrin repeat-containing protein NPR1 [Sesamum angolense]